MKYLLMISLFIACMLVGCSASSQELSADNVQTGAADARQINIDPNNVDIDLTSLETTIAYAEVTNICMNPAEYVGKTIKMRSTHEAIPSYEDENIVYHFVVYQDVCCQQPIEFITQDGVYPEHGSQVELIGVFEAYDENGQTYYRAVTDKATVV